MRTGAKAFFCGDNVHGEFSRHQGRDLADGEQGGSEGELLTTESKKVLRWPGIKAVEKMRGRNRLRWGYMPGLEGRVTRRMEGS